MPTLILKFKENILTEHTIEKGRSITIGRTDDNNITIENLAVSAHHAKIDYVGGNFLLTDLNSKNGSFVNDRQVTSHWLEDGDVLTIGKHTLVYKDEAETTAEAKTKDTMDQTMAMDTEKYRDMKAKSMQKDAILTYLAGGEGELDLGSGLIKIGKDPSSDIVTSGLLVGQTSATVSRRPEGFFLSFAGGFAKPKVNAIAVKESIKLNEFDTIEIGSVKLQFTYKK